MIPTLTGATDGLTSPSSNVNGENEVWWLSRSVLSIELSKKLVKPCYHVGAVITNELFSKTGPSSNVDREALWVGYSQHTAKLSHSPGLLAWLLFQPPAGPSVNEPETLLLGSVAAAVPAVLSVAAARGALRVECLPLVMCPLMAKVHWEGMCRFPQHPVEQE